MFRFFRTCLGGVSFANLDEVTAESGMEFGSITAVGLPADCQILIDSFVQDPDEVVIASGKIDSKIKTTPAVLSSLPNAHFIDNLAK
ncbi:MAG: YbaK/EbsC family protein [Lactobacillus equicursoris]|uniref:YbaK/EbsC family protein n=1 Tax=Lactobacillus equicursoris TaxID=420645 RepID=UPI0024301893|nr:YbaK/EbsC family protein [Lactobacillus equicursoris]MDD6407232.1 YbaK/EbsC family protein [Lactobacillus equicursoris]